MSTTTMLAEGESHQLRANCPDIPGEIEYICQYQYRTILDTGALGPVMNTANVLCIGGTVIPVCTPFHCADENCTQCAPDSNPEQRRELLKLARSTSYARAEISTTPAWFVPEPEARNYKPLFIALPAVALVAGVFTFVMKSQK